MIKLNKLANNARLTALFRFRFSSFADPYYILGVDKNASFPEIKKAFYRLANEFHPDKNDTQQAQKKFVTVKEAFERIKMEKGLMKPQNFYKTEEKESIRPNPEKYSTDEAENFKNFRDYTVFGEKASTSDEFMVFNSSFKTINDINSIKIKVDEGQMKDPTTRFGLQKYRVNISAYSQGGNKYLFVILTGLTIFTIMMNQIFSEKEVEQKENALKKLTQIHKRKTIESDLLENRKLDLASIQKSRDFMEMKKAFILEDIKKNQVSQLLTDVVISPEKMNRV